jgi:succinylglutamic semialdehyde dehydrogenase
MNTHSEQLTAQNNHKKTNYINGQWQAAQGLPFDSLQPMTSEVLWQGNNSNKSDITAAVEAARAAFQPWQTLSLKKRIEYVQAFAQQLTDHKVQLAQLIAQETGKPLWESATEVSAMIAKVDISVQAYQARTPTIENQFGNDRKILTHRPHGVLAVFGPYNFPAHLPNGHIIPALIAGNCIVFKPSEKTPKVAEFTFKCWQACNLPKGVINLVQGGGFTGKLLSEHIQIDGILFTGSVETGHAISASAPNKLLALEMGGNNALVIAPEFDQSDIKALVLTIIQSAFISAGQRCTCARRLIIPNSEHSDALILALIQACQQLKIGHYKDEVFMGSLIDDASADALLQHQKELQRGHKVLLEMKKLAPALLSPALILINQNNAVQDKEYFGPLLKIYQYSEFDQAICIANNTRYGLSAALLKGTDAQWLQFTQTIRAGIVNHNKATTGAASDMPFGGIGDSGNHRPSAFYAADYCAWPMARMEAEDLSLPEVLPVGIKL